MAQLSELHRLTMEKVVLMANLAEQEKAVRKAQDVATQTAYLLKSCAEAIDIETACEAAVMSGEFWNGWNKRFYTVTNRTDFYCYRQKPMPETWALFINPKFDEFGQLEGQEEPFVDPTSPLQVEEVV